MLAEQAAALAGRSPDVVALQEVTARSWPLWRAALETIGLPARGVLARRGRSRRASRSAAAARGVVIAARRAARRRRSLPVPWPETTLAAEIDGVVVHTAHVPNAANGWIKPDTLAALRAGLERRPTARASSAATSTRRAARSPTAP